MLNKLRRESQIFGAVSEVFKGVVVRESNDDFARICLEQAKALTESQVGWIGRLNDHGLLDTLATDDAPGWDACKLPESTVVQRINDMTIRGIWGDIIKHNASLICNDPGHFPNAVGLPEGHPQINAFLGVPLKEAEKTIGMVALANKPDGYTDDDRNAIETLSMAIVEGLRRKELDALQTLVKDVAARLNVCTDIETAQNDILKQIVHIEGIHCGAFCHLNDSGVLECVAHCTKNNLRLAASGRLILNLIGLDKLLRGQSVVISRDKLRDYSETSCFTADVKSTAFIPLLFGTKLVSIMAVASLSETDFPKHIQDMLESVAALAGAAFARIESNAAREESQARFRVLFEESPVPICEVDLSAVEKYVNEHNINSVSECIPSETHLGTPVDVICRLIRCTSVNTAAVSLFGGEDSKTLVETFYKIFYSISSGFFFQIVTNLKNGNKTFAAEMLLQTLTGKKIHTHSQWSRADDADANLEKVIFSSIDITALKRAEEIVWKASANLEQIFDNAADGLCVIDAAHTITKVNDRFPFLHGRSKNSVIGRDCSEIICQQACRPQTCPLDRILAGEPRVEEDILVERDGVQYPYLISSSPLKDTNGNIMATISVIKDMTERKRLERQLMQSQKLESIGQLAAGIAHEINTPIQYVGDNTRFLEESFGELLHLVNHVSKRKDGTNTETWEKRLDEIVDDLDAEFLTEEIPAAFSQTMEGIGRVSDIVQAMKAFSHPGSDSRTETDINAAIKTTVTVARNEWKYVADVETDFDERLPSVLCLPGELNQAFLNLIVNAAHAIGEKVSSTDEKGKIQIRTQHDKQWVEVHISDDGTGIPNEIRSRIFDPFFTTKEVGKGTGQGLAMVHTTICENHAGEIEVNSSLGVGTTFIIRLPLNR